MNKLVGILLIFFYFLSSSGVAVKADYCCGKLKKIQLVLKDTAADKEGCCKEKYQAFKVKDSHDATTAIEIATPQPIYLSNTRVSSVAQVQSIHNNDLSTNFYSPPLMAGPASIYLSNCVFRI